MIYASIYANAELNMLPIEARHLYIGTLVLADDDGRLRADARYLKGQLFGYDETITSAEVENWLLKLSEVGQIDIYERDGVRILRHPNWKEYQRIRADLYVPSRLPPPLRSRNETVTEPLLNISKDNIRKEREDTPLHKTQEYLKSLPSEDVKEFNQRFEASERQITKKAEDLLLWCESNGRSKKNYRAFLLTALRKDFPERRRPIPLPPKPQMTPEELQHLEKISKEIASHKRI